MELSQPVYNPLLAGKKGLFALVIFGSFFIVWAAFWSPYLLAGLLGALFLVVFVSSRTARWMIFPTVLIFNQFLIRNAGVPYMIGGIAIQPIDWMAILLFFTVLLKGVFRGSGLHMRTGLEKPIGIFLVAFAFSLFAAPDLTAGVINWGHTMLYFLAFFAMVADWRGVPLKRIWGGYFLWSLLAALSAVWHFFESGGGRSLGLVGIPLNHLIIPVLCFELSRLSLGETPGRWWVIALFVVAAVATETRGLWLTGGVLLAVWILSGHFLRPLKFLAARQRNTRVVGIVLLLFLLFLVLLPYLGQVEQRAKQMVEQGGTVYLRLFLWGTAWRLFVSHPIIGIGAGQFVGAMAQFPEMKNLAVFEWTHGLSAHNVLLTFLAETGLVGTLGFLFLLIATVRFAWKGVRGARTLEELGWGWGFFLIFTVFSISFIFAGTWQYEFAFLLALLVLFVKNLETSRSK